MGYLNSHALDMTVNNMKALLEGEVVLVLDYLRTILDVLHHPHPIYLIVKDRKKSLVVKFWNVLLPSKYSMTI
jgi:hypothetical protein